MSDSALAKNRTPQVSDEPLTTQGCAHGIWAPALTPLNERLEPDRDKAIAYYRWLLESGCHGLAFMGTNSEATSFSVAERIGLLEAVLAAGIEPKRLMVGSGCAALSDSVALTKHATEAGCSVLTLPPFYYKDIGEDGLYASYAELIERVASPDLRLYFYHFPKLSMVPIVPAVIERLLAAYPGVIKGLKDSSGDAEGCAAYIERFPELATFPGNEILLLDMLKLGGAGTITAGANVFPGAIRAVYDAYRAGDEADQPEQLVQAEVGADRRATGRAEHQDRDEAEGGSHDPEDRAVDEAREDADVLPMRERTNPHGHLAALELAGDPVHVTWRPPEQREQRERLLAQLLLLQGCLGQV